MNLMWRLLYNLIVFPTVVITAYSLVFFNRKVRRGLRGRRKSGWRVRQFKENFIDHYGRLYWFHVASLGEFEQARPVIEGLKEISPEATVVVSFFSPSGYEVCIHPDVDLKFYLPLDFPWVMRHLLRVLKPHRVIFASYDIWPNLIWACREAGISTILFAARIVPGSTKQWPILRGFYRTIYNAMDAIYTVSDADDERLRHILGSGTDTFVRNLGNPRYDRVMERRLNGQMPMRTDERVIVLGSVHREDEAVVAQPLLDMLKNGADFRVLWAPHDPEPEVIESLGNMLTGAGIAWGLFGAQRGKFNNAQVLIVDGVGYLAELYHRGMIAYVGGGFGSSVHNVMEPAITGMPVIFGPRYDRSHEAEQLVEAGGGVSISNASEFAGHLEGYLGNDRARQAAGAAALKVMESNLGATTRILQAVIGR